MGGWVLHLSVEVMGLICNGSCCSCGKSIIVRGRGIIQRDAGKGSDSGGGGLGKWGGDSKYCIFHDEISGQLFELGKE